MEPLEDVLRKVEDLRSDFYAEIVIQEEEGHDEETGPEGRPRGAYYDQDPRDKGWVVDKQRITAPNTQKGETARTELQEIYDSSEWYSARYAAGSVLNKPIGHEIESWIQKLREQLKAETVIKGETDAYHKRSSSGGDAREAVRDEPDRIEPDFNTRNKAVEDAAALLNVSGSRNVKKLLKEAYNLSYNSDTQIIIPSIDLAYRIKAGKALGYSPSRIWSHEHPVAVTVTEIVAIAGAASGLGYALLEYFSK